MERIWNVYKKYEICIITFYDFCQEGCKNCYTGYFNRKIKMKTWHLEIIIHKPTKNCYPTVELNLKKNDCNFRVYMFDVKSVI